MKNKWIVVGSAWISGDFIKSLQVLGYEVVGILSINKEEAIELAKKYNVKNTYSKIEEIETDYDYVYVATPNAFHYQYAKKFLEMKKDVFVEKIMTHSLTTTKELFQIAHKNNCKLMEGYANINDEMWQNWVNKPKTIKTNLMQVSSKIKNNTFTTASTFRSDMFGGALPDLGCYIIAFSVFFLGNIVSFKLSNIKMMNGVEVDITVKLIHENGTSEFRTSKIEDGDNSVFFDNSKVSDHVNPPKENRMFGEIKNFVSTKTFDTEWISIEVARVVELMKEEINKTR